MCDNCCFLKEKIEVKDEVVDVLKVVLELDENYGIKILIDFMFGREIKEMKDFCFDKCELFGKGKEKD